MKKVMYVLTAIFIIETLLLYFVYSFTEINAFFSAFVTFLTFSYHFLMRLFVGFVVSLLPDKFRNYKIKLFAPRKIEKKIFKLLRVKKWKANIPTYNPESFSPETHTAEEIAAAMCGAELTHEIIVIFSFVPILFSIRFGVPAVFIITSVVAAIVDLIFVVVQRYNRPRVVRFIKRKESRGFLENL